MNAQLLFAGAGVLCLVLAAAQDAPKTAPPATAPPASSIAETDPAEAAAREALAAMAKAYAECSSYHDTGTVTTKYTQGGSESSRRVFKTAFVRGATFRFEYSDVDEGEVGKPYIVWADAHSTRSWWHVKPGVKTELSLSMALAGATGVSGGSAHTIPRLLLPDAIGGWVITQVVNPRCEGEELVAGRACLKIVTKHPFGSPLTLWIDKETHLVRQLFEQQDLKDKGLAWEETTTYAPEANVNIEPAELEFNPPTDQPAAPK